MGPWRVGAIRQVGLRDQEASRDAASGFHLSHLCWIPGLAILAPLQKGCVHSEAKPACYLWLLTLSGRCPMALLPLPCLSTLQRFNFSTKHLAYFWEGKKKSNGKNPLSNFLVPAKQVFFFFYNREFKEEGLRVGRERIPPQPHNRAPVAWIHFSECR